MESLEMVSSGRTVGTTTEAESHLWVLISKTEMGLISSPHIHAQKACFLV